MFSRSSVFDADYRFNTHVDAYLGAMYSDVHNGLASGYFFTTNINPTVGVRYKFSRASRAPTSWCHALHDGLPLY
jgi:hypothetical protein